MSDEIESVTQILLQNLATRINRLKQVTGVIKVALLKFRLWATRINRLKQVTGVADRDIPMRCPFCGANEFASVQCFLGTATTSLTADATPWFATECKECRAHGPGMHLERDAIWGWNQFVSHGGKVPRE